MKSFRIVVGVVAGLILLAIPQPPGFSQLDVIVQGEGNIPLILSAPHGGVNSFSGAQERTCGTKVTDSWTLGIAENLQRQLGAVGTKAFVVFARFDRKYVDVNAERSPCGCTDPAGCRIYDDYHRLLTQYIKDVRARFPKGGLLLDIHGHNREGEENVIFRGTRDGRAVGNLRNRYGDGAVTGKNSLFGILKAAGYNVFPPIGSAFGNPDEILNGGEVVERHGTINPNSIDAVQIEIGRSLRDTEKERDRLVSALKDALLFTYRTYYR